MLNRYIFIALSFLFIIIETCGFAQNQDDIVYENKVFDSDLKTVNISPLAWDLLPAVLYLDSDNSLLFSFDDFSSEQKDYSYRIIHCTYSWHKSDLSEIDYMNGFGENDIKEYDNSFNTKLKYIHYKLALPNSDVNFKISGNYIIQIFESFNSEKVLLQMRFKILENIVDVKSSIKHPIDLDYRNSYQEVKFSLMHKNLTIDNPLKDIKILIQQNNIPNSIKSDYKPLYIRKDELIYDNDIFFAANNEYRNFDIKSLRYQTMNIQSINLSKDTSFVKLFADETRRFKPYLLRRDINGKCVIDVQEYEDASVEADYVLVEFTYKCSQPIIDDNIYVYGSFTGFVCDNNNKMKYDFEAKAYKIKILVKQGYYNYAYANVSSGGDISMLDFEGSFWQTENDYFIYVYYYDVSYNTDRLVGFKKINSIEKL